MSTASLANRWITGKARIKELQDELLQIEAELAEQIGVVEGSQKTSHVDGYKITVKSTINRTLDPIAWDNVSDKIPVDLWPVKTKLEPDTKGCKWLAENRPDLWLVASQAITEKLSKPSFTIEEEAAE